MRLRTLALLAALAALGACKAKTDAFYADTFTCDPEIMDTCGTSKTGRPMVCYSARSLDGTGFCAEACDPKDASMARSGVVCTTMTRSITDAGQTALGALLTECAPSDPASCPEKLSCYRTALMEDKGVCLAMPVCNTNMDCLTTSHRICAADAIKSAVGPLASMLATSNLHCVAAGCKLGGTPCPIGEACIGTYLSVSQQIDELCVPSCDVNKACPPNFTCLQDASWAPGAAPICFPGMLGTRCAEADDCLLGACVDVGVEFKVCSIPCKTDDECKTLNTKSDVYYCGNGFCVTPRPFQGSNCGADGDCISSQTCVVGSIGGTQKHGECRVPCDAEGKCPSRGGLPHVCLGADHKGGCYPSTFGVPCLAQQDCRGDLECLEAADDPRSPENDFATHICTITCTEDKDCDADSWTKGLGFCRDGICRHAGGMNAPCDRNAQCSSDRCDPGTKRCTFPMSGPQPS
jgi:hypothetical protein